MEASDSATDTEMESAAEAVVSLGRAAAAAAASASPADDGVLLNDDGSRVAFGTEVTDLVYCGRDLGRDAIVGSDGTCGPRNGPQCPSCRRFQAGPRRVDLLLQNFPHLDRSAAVGALRSSGGVARRAAELLREMGVPGLDPPTLALLPLPSGPAVGGVDAEEARRLAEGLGVPLPGAEAALRRHSDVQRAAAWILDDLDEVEAAAAEDRERAERAEAAEREAREARGRATRAAAEAIVPDKASDGMLELARACRGFPKVGEVPGADAGAAAVVDGHRLVHPGGGRDDCCVLCAASVPSAEAGSRRCELCGLCEGCVRSGSVVPRCLRLRNGSRLHPHPLVFGLDRLRRCRCDVGDRPTCGDVVWSCEACDFDVCAACASRPAPRGFDLLAGVSAAGGRARGGGGNSEGDGGDDDDDEGSESDEESEDGDGGGEGARDRIDSESFDAVAAERRAAARWEATHRDPPAGEVIVGTGETGSAVLAPAAPEPRGPDGQREARRRLKSEAPRLAETRLAEEAQEALELFRLGGSGNGGGGGEGEVAAAAVSAADVSHAEDLLHRARAVGCDPLVRRELCHSVAAGRLDLAGALLLSEAYAPVPGGGDRGAGDDDDSADAEPERVECFCGEAIDGETAPDGAVGCLKGHAMHPSCASDLLLSGGTCPSCRLHLHFPRVPEEEARAAAELVDAEVRRSIERAGGGSDGDGKIAVDDFVQVCADSDECARAQMDEPRAGGWVEDMKQACGRVGRVTEIIRGDGDEEVFAARVRTKGLSHALVSIVRGGGGYRCKGCSMLGPSRQTGQRMCSRCDLCERCCRRRGGGGSGDDRRPVCPPTCQEWAWSPALLRPAGSALADASLLDPEEAAARAAERHVLRLRAELKTVSAAREAIRAKCDEINLPQLVRQRKDLEEGSVDALRDLWGKVSFADWLRARHLLRLAQKWGDSNEAWERRALVCNAAREGDLDSVARAVRRHNASRMAENLRWRDAVQATGEYLVAPTAKVQLRAFPADFAPRTGFALHPGTRFQSRREILDNGGNLWLQVDHKSFPGAGSCDGKVVADLDEQMTSRALVGAKVQRGPDWEGNDQDGGEGNEGVIVQVIRSGKVAVRWDSSLRKHEYRAGDGHHDLIFSGAAPQPPQGWLCVRPAGARSAAVVWRARSALRCFCCSDGLVSPKLEMGRYGSAKGSEVKEGDRLLVAATLDPVVVKACIGGRIRCSFDSQKIAGIDAGMDGCDVWYRPEDLVLPKGKGDVFGEEALPVKGQLRTRREVVLMSGGDEFAARRAWTEAKKRSKMGKSPEDEGVLNFASCVQGHFLHARCLQGALLAGGYCPAIGCSEPLSVPRVKHQRNDDTCCGGGANDDIGEAVSGEAELLSTADALIQRSRAEGAATTDGEVTSAGLPDLKMCPACCSGPLINQNCSDMKAHHGQCSRVAIRGTSGSETPCSSGGTFRVTPVDIAERIKRMTLSESVTDVLPKCPSHKVPVMFNGCLSCGHLFTDTDWDEMPKWDPKAKSLLELDHKKRKAADLLAKQVRAEAALLRFEKDQFESISTSTCGICAGSGSASIQLPPPPPPAVKYHRRGCGPSCDLGHPEDGDCLVCGRNWGVHSGHTCPGGRARGSWIVQ